MSIVKRIRPWMVLVPLFFLSVIWGVWGLLETGKKDFLDACYLTLQLITLNAGLEDGPKPWKLEISRFVLPAITSYAVLRGFFILAGQNWTSLKLRFFVSHHYIICGLSEQSMALAKDLLAQAHSVAVVDSDPNNPNINSLRQLKGIFLEGDATKPEILKQAQLAKASHLILLTGTDVDNFSALQSAISLLDSSKHALKCHVHVANLENRALFEEKGVFFPPIRKNGIEISLFNVFDNIAIALFQRYPPGERADTLAPDAESVNILLAGFGTLGEAVLVEIMQMAHFGNQKPTRIVVLDDDASVAERKFLHRYREVKNHINGAGLKLWDLEFIDDVEKARALHRYAEILACHDQPDQAMICINELWDRWQCEEGEAHTRFFLNSPAEGMGANKEIFPFGKLSVACSAHIVIAKEQERLAKQSHDEYNRAKLGDQGNRPDLSARVRVGAMTLDEALKQHDAEAQQSQKLVWESLSLFKQGANFTEKRHYNIKLLALGLKVEDLLLSVPGPEHPELSDLPYLVEIAKSGAELEHVTAFMAMALENVLSKDELVTRIDALAKAEHKRWNAYHVLNNFRYGSRKDERLRTHDCLLNDEELTTKRGDTIKYDYQNIYQIWDVLRAGQGA